MSVFNRRPVKTGGFCLVLPYKKRHASAGWHLKTPAFAGVTKYK